MTTPAKKPHGRRSQTSENCRFSENSDPSVLCSTPRRKPVRSTATAEAWKFSENFDPNLHVSTPRKLMKSPATKPANSKKKPTPKTPGRTLPYSSPAQDRKPIIAKKNPTEGKKDLESRKSCRAICEDPPAPEAVFTAKDQMIGAGVVVQASSVEADGSKEGIEKMKKNWVAESKELPEGGGSSVVDNSGSRDSRGSSKMRKMRNMMLEEATSSMPEPGAGRVMYLVKAFERILSLSKDAEGTAKIENKKKVMMSWALPGLQQPPKAKESEVPSSSVSSSSEFTPGKDFERDCRDHSSVESNNDRLSWGNGTSDGSRSRRNSTGSSGRSWNKKLKVASQQPFKLRTEQRGRLKEEHFLKKLKEMLLEEEKQRIPIAQGLPWTTDEPESLLKPPIKEPTEPIDLFLHSDVRAVERAEFDLHVAERLSFFEQIKLEKEMQRKMEEEEEIRRLRRELIPRAQPMPYFDRPFIPRRSMKPKTVTKEPKFHTRPLKSWETP